MVRLSTAIAKNTFSNTSDDYDQSREFTSNIDQNELISCFDEKSWSKNAFCGDLCVKQDLPSKF